MPRFTVFHYDNGARRFSEEAFADWPGPAYVRVAQVDAASLGEVFGATNSLDTPWTDNETVLLLPEDLLTLAAARTRDPRANSSVVLRKRSTSVGDVIVHDATGVAHGVAGTGFTPLGTLPEAAATRLQALRTEFLRYAAETLTTEVTSYDAMRRAALRTATYDAILALQDYIADLRDGREPPWSYRQEGASVSLDG
jgi:hypothetical protein